MQITAAQRRARLATRHLLAPAARADTPEQVADALVGLHATDPATVYLAAAARLAAPAPDAVERALYQDLTLVRLLAMRRTMFVVGRDLAPVVDSAAARAVAARERRNLLAHLADGGGWDAAWLARAEQAVHACLAEGPPLTGAELGAAVPALRERVAVAVGKPYETTQTVASRVLRVLAAENRIRRDRPDGSWTSSRFRWAPAEPLPELPAAEARAELARRWLAGYGPGTEADLGWWTGWNRGDTRRALAAVDARSVRLDEGDGYVLPGDEQPPEPEPYAALLPALDPTAMGWQQRGWYLPPQHAAQLFDRTGNVGPTVWWGGRVVGGWAQRPDGELVWRLLEDVGREAGAAVAAEAGRLAAFVGAARVTPRFRTPLERALAAG
ncbi:winged helix DNA-binding domain-containing protein [Streptacidiphilus sp. PB12-B1b]|uniref:winged helix DNA-binding domain-containing protein n=1 Tax=Streptacidiphilus sp. PB12-B1b TaxID=2705012 RepID=UPI0015FD8661|nr:winged helix DNA-binding domain-containing protein [Streptacidiphilus sp. PB12-B1b]QMU76429.1 winged helix DNA-binding domain-containing protein [Streptacidiphilus sp. PB12-B1b]